MSAPPLHFDACILGGGIAGLWTLARLRHQGRSALLLSRGPLGGGQTIWSQGIIHGGIKYALGGEASAASRAIAGMPEVWAGCLRGEGSGDGAGVDLSSVKPLSACQYLWTTAGLVSKIAGVAASKAIRTPVEKVERGAWPAAFVGGGEPSRGVDLYRVTEPVLPSREVVEAIAGPHRETIREIAEVEAIEGGARGAGAMVRARLVGDEVVEIRARLVVCVAGEGNERLAALAGVKARMQRRPLHMVMARGPQDRVPSIFGHCLGASTVPRVTITSIDHEGERVWYIGGGIAEEGVSRSEGEQIVAAKREVAACVPWIDVGALRWATGRIDRAEGLTHDGRRPDVPVVVREGPVVVAWPTKLAFAPALAGQIAEFMGRSVEAGAPAVVSTGATPPIAALPWARAAWA